MTATSTTPLLNYSKAQRHWKRNVSYLLAIVCIMQLSLLPIAILDWVERLHYGTTVWGVYYGDPTGFYTEIINLVCGAVAVPLTALLIATTCILVLLEVWWARRLLQIFALVQFAALCVQFVGDMVRMNSGYGWTFYTPYGPSYGIEESPSKLQHYVSIAYPVILLLLVLPKQMIAREAATARNHAAILWRFTAIACALYAFPTLYSWCRHFDDHWETIIRLSFAPLLHQSWIHSIRGIAQLAGTLACVCAIPLLIYARFRGPIGRHALLICAALLAVAAADPLTSMAAGISTIISESGRPGGLMLDEVERPVMDLSTFVLALAFPLSLRVALSLTELRDKLDARPARNADAADPLNAANSPAYPQSPAPQIPAQSGHLPS